MNIETMLKNYRVNKAKVRCGELEIEGIEEYLNGGHAEQWELRDQAIEGMSLASAPIPDMPRSITNKFHSVTESVCIGYRREWNTEPPTIEKMKEMINNIKSRIYPLKQECKLVDNVLLSCLNEKELFIIKSLYIEEYSWENISRNYSERFKEIREIPTLKDIRKYAFIKMKSVTLSVA